MPVDPQLKHLLHGFVNEATEMSGQVTRRLLEAERAAQADLVPLYNEIARHLHTIKGSTATLGLDDVSWLAHAMEGAFEPLRSRRAPPSAADVDTLLEALDAVMNNLRRYAEDAPSQGNDEALLARLAGMADQAPPEPCPPSRAEVPVSETREAAQVAQARPHLDDADDGWRISVRDLAPLMRALERLRESRLRFAARKRDIARAVEGLAGPNAADARSVAAMLAALGRSTDADADEIASIADALEETVKGVLTQPLHTVLAPLQRTVRDLARSSGKQAALSVVGGELSLDRRVLAALRAALVHLVRNAIDHGVEPPDVRDARGKHREGAVVIRAEHQGDVVLVEVADDGEGIPTSRVLEKALERGLLDAKTVARMDAKQVCQLVFLPGLSTRDAVSETSGRGVGLDVVKSQIEAVGGHVEIESVAGQGTRFILVLPTEIGTSPLMVVLVGGQELALPLLSVQTVVKVQSKRVHAGRSLHLEHEEELLPIVDLGARLGLRAARPPAEGQPSLVLNVGGKRSVVVVDELGGFVELVVRALPPEVREVQAYRGAGASSTGRPILVLRPEWVVEAPSQVEPSSSRLALVVDDALTARTLHRGMLEAGGYTVHTASDAQQALDRLRNASYDIVVCDLAMEGTDGLALTSLIRSDPRLRSLPVVLVTAHESEAVRAQALEAGADAFLSKRECRAGRLLAATADAIARRRGVLA